MGRIFYKLSNGEDIEITFEMDEERGGLCIAAKLFNGSTTITRPIEGVTYLNELLDYVEENYERLAEEDYEFSVRAFCD